MTMSTLTLTGKDIEKMIEWHKWIERLIQQTRGINIAGRILEQ